MIERYSTPRMAAIWTDEARMAAWLEVEIAVCEAWARLGKIPDNAMEDIRVKASFDMERVAEIEAVTQHDVIAFVSSVAENIGEASKYLHYGLTSSDVLDTGLALQLQAAGALIEEETVHLGQILQRRAQEFSETLMIGRTHGVHAEPTTFGMVLGLWAFEVHRGVERLREATKQVSVGKISGAVGTYANVDPQVEEITMDKLGLEAAPISTQIVQRDRHANFMAALALLASTLEKIAMQIRHYQRTEVLEAEEFFAPGQKGSSAMPHKRNPIICERICGQARVIRCNMLAAFENIPLWHERDISHSSVERVILPDSTILLHYMLEKACWLIDNLMVHPENMAKNMEKSYGLFYSQRVLLALIKAGMLRDEAYAVVQRNAMKAWEEKAPFVGMLKADAEVTKVLKTSEIRACFDPSYQLRHMEVIMRRVADLKW